MQAKTKDIEPSESLCIHPFASLSIHASGHITRCLMSEESMGEINSENDSLDIWNNEEMNQLRNKMLKGEWDAGCRSCLRKEKQETKSKRQHWKNIKVTRDLWGKKEVFNTESKEDIYFLDMAFNNFCNFKCRMCSSAYSSKWVEDEAKLKEMGLKGGSGTWSDKTAVTLDNPMRSTSDEVLSRLVQRLNKVRRIDIVGGEPFLTKDLAKFSDLCQENNIGSEVKFTVTTNGSLFDEDYLKKLSIFKHVGINISVDATHDLFNYIRAGKTINWDEFNQNIDKFIAFANKMNQIRPNSWKVNLNGAFQVYNMFNTTAFVDWVIEKFNWDNSHPPEESSMLRNSFELRLLMTPSQLNVHNAPEALAKHSRQYINELLAKYPFLKDIDESHYLSDILKTLDKSIRKDFVLKKQDWYLFCLYTLSLDKIREQSYKSVLPPLLCQAIQDTLVSQDFNKVHDRWKKGLSWGGHCSMPWEAITITGQGDVKPCCQFRGKVGNLYENDNQTVEELYNSDAIKGVRKSFIVDEKNEACSSCWEREGQINKSRRLWFYEKFKKNIKDSLEYDSLDVKKPNWLQMDINLSNRCNLKCRMCGVWASHKWADDEVKLAEKGNPYKRETRPDRLGLKELSLEKLESLIPNMKRIQRIDFKGGEPMLAKHHTAFLELLIKNKLNDQLTLHYTTNGTVFNQKICSLFQQFKRVEVVFSIEGTDPLYSYIRGGKEYNTQSLVENLKKYDELGNVKIMCNVAMQAYNLPNIYPLLLFIKQLPLKNYSHEHAFNCIVNSPSYLSPFVWPMEVREKYARTLSKMERFDFFSDQLVKKPFDPELFKKFLSYTEKLDRLRGENYFEIYPELKEFKNYASRC